MSDDARDVDLVPDKEGRVGQDRKEAEEVLQQGLHSQRSSSHVGSFVCHPMEHFLRVGSIVYQSTRCVSHSVKGP